MKMLISQYEFGGQPLSCLERNGCYDPSKRSARKLQNNAPKKSIMMMMLIKSLPRWNLICSQASKEGLGVESPIAVTKNPNNLKWHMLFLSDW